MLRRYQVLKIFICLFFSSILLGCGPAIHYLGDTHAPTATVDLFYDAKEVKQEFTVIGRMTNDQYIDYGVEVVKEEMIKKAKQVGANGIIFSDISVNSNAEVSNRLSVKAELIKYKER